MIQEKKVTLLITIKRCVVWEGENRPLSAATYKHITRCLAVPLITKKCFSYLFSDAHLPFTFLDWEKERFTRRREREREEKTYESTNEIVI